MEKKTKSVFLGGTCNGSTWREKLIRDLEIDYFDPVVDNWTQECMDEEIRQREICDYCLYVITPKMKGVLSIAEVVCDSVKRPEKTILCIITSDANITFDEHQTKSLNEIKKMVEECGAKVCNDLKEVADYVNGK